MLTHEEISSLDEILKRHNYDSSSVIAVMQDIQKKYRYLPQEALTAPQKAESFPIWCFICMEMRLLMAMAL